MNRNIPGAHLRVSLSTHYKKAQGTYDTSVEIRCYKLKAGQGKFSEKDLNAFGKACEAGLSDKDYEEDVDGKDIWHKWYKTHYESKLIDGKYWVIATREGISAKFELEEWIRVQEAMKEAIAGSCWFGKIKSFDDIPQKTTNCRPPKAGGLHINATIGKVNGGGITLEISIDNDDFFGKPYNTAYGIRFANGAWTGGGNIKKIIEHLIEAKIALKNDDYFRFPEDYSKSDYSVETLLKSKQIILTYTPGEFFKDHTIQKGVFTIDDIDEIDNLKATAEKVRKWFIFHEDLFYEAR